MIEHVTFKIGNFKDKWRSICYLRRLLKIRIKERVKTQHKTSHNFSKKFPFIHLCFVQKRQLLFIAIVDVSRFMYLTKYQQS